jgi:excisionase family DNA binding protein
MEERLLSIDELAEKLNCHPRTISRNLKSIPHSKIGSRLRFDASEVLASLKVSNGKTAKRKVKVRPSMESEFTGVLG